jgi:hypothetical protein
MLWPGDRFTTPLDHKSGSAAIDSTHDVIDL